MKILIIDDSPDALAVAKNPAGLRRPHDSLRRRRPGGFGNRRPRAPDLVLLDVDMPDLNGFAVCQQLKANADLCMIPIIFLSGSGGMEEKIRGLNLGAVDFVTKPFDAFELRARVNAALRTKRMQDLLIEHAKIDPLTGLPNRRAWTNAFNRSGPGSCGTADICRSS